MTGIVRNMLDAYEKMRVDQGVADASPHKLIAMLYEGAIVAISHAKLHMKLGDVAARGVAISKAISIIDEGLKASIDMKVGGELSQNLYGLYTYMTNQLLKANLEKDIVKLEEVEGLLKELEGAWLAIGVQKAESINNMVQADKPPAVAASYGKV
jgi:flagellar protein FliS